MLQEILLLVAGIYLAWSLGANDATNILSTAVGSRTISFRKAMVLFIVCLAIGAIFLSENVIKTVSSGIVDAELITMTHATVALFVSAGWVHFATWRRWPVSISQSVVSSVLGIGVVEGVIVGENLVQWATVLTVAAVWLLSPLFGFAAGWILFKLVHGFVRHSHLYFKDTLRDWLTHPWQSFEDWISGDLKKRDHFFKILLLLSAGYMAIGLGANTVASTTGLIHSGFNGQSAILGFELQGGEELFAMKMLVLVAVILGIVTYGRNLVDFLGNRLMKLNALRGAIIQTATATIIVICALFGYPVSSTGIFVGAFLGLGRGESEPRMHEHLANGLLMAFFVTIPVTAVLSGTILWAMQ